MKDALNQAANAREVLRRVTDDNLEGVLQWFTRDYRGRRVDKLASERISNDQAVLRLHDGVRQRVTVRIGSRNVDEQLPGEDLLRCHLTDNRRLVEECVSDLTAHPRQQRVEPGGLRRSRRICERRHHTSHER
ncbi:hypothetical protein MHIP_56440 [Mycolicibacterium hippocampi]|uniref:Uncharacterized protein n=1 Tax=Mycolicibacterium hippocampi TaxID=659824 RepID=A0A7I9ZVV1_9MYCO|nr:hypothetical protein MHIP_56440 [Mycolicibacterium hippocampi]